MVVQLRKECDKLQAQLSHAIAISAVAHEGQYDKAGKSYILHPLRIMFSMDETDTKSQIVAILHDVIEDTDWTFDAIKNEEFEDDIIEALQLLTHDLNVPYNDYIIGIKTNELATKVKIGDLLDNTRLDRLIKTERLDKTTKRMVKYVCAYKFLTDQITQEEFLNFNAR